MPIQRVLVVDDDSFSREFLTEAAKSLGLETTSCSNGEAALAHARSNPVDIVFTDLRMPGMSGVDLVRAMTTEFPETPVVLVTAHGTVETAVEAMKLGAVDFLVKPCTP
ncbi:MAG TPA: response regulator, partial [Planctomycetes bacterium]|nr:response regulator [Planctomycetota bacterium]